MNLGQPKGNTKLNFIIFKHLYHRQKCLNSIINNCYMKRLIFVKKS